MAQPQTPTDEALPRGPRLGKFRRRVLLLLLLVFVAIGAFPWLVCHTPLRSLALARVVPTELGTASIESLSLGWLTGINAQGVVLVDPAGQKIFEADRVTVSRSLLNLALDRRDLGTIHIDAPNLYVVTRRDGSNLEDLLAVVQQLAGADDSASTAASPQYTLELHEGVAYLADPELREMWRADHLEVAINHPSSGPLEVSAAGRIGPLNPQTLAPNGPAGDARFVLKRQPDGQQQGELVCDTLPLAAARPWLRRWDPAIQLAGTASGKGQIDWQAADTAPLSLANVTAYSLGKFEVANFAYTGATVANRPLELPRIEMPWNLELTSGQLTFKQLAISTAAGTASGVGVIPVAAWGNTSQLLAGSRAVVEGQVNLAELTRLAPQLIPLREGSQITGGTVSFRVTAEPDAEALRVLANLESSAIAGRRGNKTLAWDTPLRVRLTARQYANRLLVESANVNSEFAQLALTGDRQQMRLEGEFDLDRLADRLEEFIDLGDLQLAGTGKLSGAMQLDAAGGFTAGGAGSLNNLVVTQAGRKMADEAVVQWQANCQGQYDAQHHLPKSLTTGNLIVTAGSDELVVTLTGVAALAESIAATTWPVRVELVGNASNWQRRASPFVAQGDWQIDGRIAVDGTGAVRAQPFQLTLTQSQATLDELVAQSPQWNITENHIEWSGDLELDTAAGKLASRNGQFVSSTVAASLRNWMWSLDDATSNNASGEFAVRADLARLAAWQRTPPEATSRLAAAGQLVGNIKLDKTNDQLRAQLDVRSDNMVLQRIPTRGGAATAPTQPMRVSLTGQVTYQPSADTLLVSNLRGESQIVGISAQGKLVGLTTDPVAELAGTVDYDLAQISQLFIQPLTGPDVVLTGRHQAEVRLSGPLATARTQVVPVAATSVARDVPLTASLLAPWESASVFGLPIGGGTLQAQMSGQNIEIKPLDFAVSGGRLTAAPRVVLTPEPAVVTLGPGPLLTDVTITPEISNRLLKFSVPILDRATQTEGKFSVRLDGATIPVSNPAAGSIAGQMNVYSIRVGPGPTMQPIVALAARIEALAKGTDPLALADNRANRSFLLVRDRVVDFRLIDGRVYHQGLEFQIGDVVVRSSGSVGLDETLNLSFDVTHPDLNGKSIQIPIGGTLAKWEPDTRALLQNVANRAIDTGINRALDRLFRRE